MKYIFFWLVIASGECITTIDYERCTRNVKRLPRFWTNTGFAPLASIDNVKMFFESNDLHMNLEIIGSLPNAGLESVRIHWLLNLLTINKENGTVNFGELDKFVKALLEYKLEPAIEFMTTLKLENRSRKTWSRFASQILSRYIEKYGISRVAKWKFETWNEPDLKLYNVLNFTLSDYLDYVKGIKKGMKRTEKKYFPRQKLKCRGPAGLFRDRDKHVFCWTLLEQCNREPKKCPIDIITFHRKGNGTEADEIVDGSLELLQEFSQKFPNLPPLEYSNTEADPIKTWSEPRDFQADARYASMLVETIFQFWNVKFNERRSRLESISHDNSFMNFHPHAFTQRTLLARFQMNNSLPRYTQFIQKPVFSALGLVSNLGTHASNIQRYQNFTYIVSQTNGESIFYSCIIVVSHVNTKTLSNSTRANIEIVIRNLPLRRDLTYIVEAVDNKRTNPSLVYEVFNKPVFPSQRTIDEMRQRQNPMILEQPGRIVDGEIVLNALLKEPFTVALRICSKNVSRPMTPFNLRLRILNPKEVILFWSEPFHRARCIKTYEIFFRREQSYDQIETDHIPFLYHQLQHSSPGCFKVRSLDINRKHSEFSRELCYGGNAELQGN